MIDNGVPNTQAIPPVGTFAFAIGHSALRFASSCDIGAGKKFMQVTKSLATHGIFGFVQKE